MKALRPGAKVIGVETEVLPCMLQALDAGKPVTLEGANTIADGIAVKRAGDLTFEHVKRYVDEIVTVSEEEIASAILYLLEREKTVVEGAGAVGGRRAHAAQDPRPRRAAGRAPSSPAATST